MSGLAKGACKHRGDSEYYRKLREIRKQKEKQRGKNGQ